MRKINILHRAALSLFFMLASNGTQAKITLLKGNVKSEQGLGRFNIQMEGTLRPRVLDVMGGKDHGNYQRNGYDGGTRLRFHVNYLLDEDLTWVNFYQVVVDVPKTIGWRHHYAPGARNTGRRQLYSGLKSQLFGQLTYGQQNSVYYRLISGQINSLSGDLSAEPVRLGVDSNYDGSWRARKSLMYENQFGRLGLFGSYLFEEHPLALKNHLRYVRHGGAALGLKLKIMPKLTWSLAWDTTRASLRDVRRHQQKHVNQRLLGSSLSWQPGCWTVILTEGWYHHFIAMKTPSPQHYFANNAWGTSYFIGPRIPLHSSPVKAIMPYYFGAHLREGAGHRHFRNENGLAVAFYVGQSLRIDYQHIFRTAEDHPGDVNAIRVEYNF